VANTSQKNKPTTKKNNSIDINSNAVRELAEILRDTHLSEIEYETEHGRIRVVKELIPTPSQVVAPTVTSNPTFSLSESTKKEEQDTQKEVPKDDLMTHPGLIKSPMVGTAYLASQPGADPFVTEGKKVSVGDTLLIVEAMKVMNPIKAVKDGTVKKIIVSDAEPVEFDQPLIVIE
jgi:acetyl-CoA carboxylase biotin carboxyl carrier protein